jgi:hypothetical protein
MAPIQVNHTTDMCASVHLPTLGLTMNIRIEQSWPATYLLQKYTVLANQGFVQEITILNNVLFFHAEEYITKVNTSFQILPLNNKINPK